MTSQFHTELFDTLRESNTYRLTGMVEMAQLSTSVREQLLDYFSNRAWPLLQQPEFANLQATGPWLFAARPGATLSGQGDFHSVLNQIAGDAVCGWIVSALPPAEMAVHLSQANTASGPEGDSYLLRYHTEAALTTLHARCDLPGIAQWLAPIRSWWVPIPHPGRRAWRHLAGFDRPHDRRRARIVLDQACRDALAGDPLSYHLADQLKDRLTAAGHQKHCHGTCLGLAQHYLTQARQLGLSREDDLLTYGILMALEGEALRDAPAWQEALSEARDQGRPLAEAVQAHVHLKNL